MPFNVCFYFVESLPLIEKLLDQVIQAHKGLKYFHIGADEVSIMNGQFTSDVVYKKINKKFFT